MLIWRSEATERREKKHSKAYTSRPCSKLQREEMSGYWRCISKNACRDRGYQARDPNCLPPGIGHQELGFTRPLFSRPGD
jgi:hypothetical protein